MSFPLGRCRSLFLFLWAISIGSVKAVTNQFRDWYPQFGSAFESTKNGPCADEYVRYLIKNRTVSIADQQSFPPVPEAPTPALVNCLLEYTSESIKGNMTGAQVLLGVMPTVLSLIGASADEMALLFSVGQRPFLTTLLALASPSAYVNRAFAQSAVTQLLRHDDERCRQWRPKSLVSQLGISLLEYIVVIGLVANVMHCSWEIGIRAMSAVLTDDLWLAMLWVGMGAFVQLLDVLVLRLRVQGWRDRPSKCLQRSQNTERDTFLARTRQVALDIARNEWFPSASMGLDVRVITFPETKRFLVAEWVQSTLAILHVVFGTLLWSSMMFLGTTDALFIVIRFFVSTLICRIIVRYELAGLREACVDIKRIRRGMENYTDGSLSARKLTGGDGFELSPAPRSERKMTRDDTFELSPASRTFAH